MYDNLRHQVNFSSQTKTKYFDKASLISFTNITLDKSYRTNRKSDEDYLYGCKCVSIILSCSHQLLAASRYTCSSLFFNWISKDGCGMYCISWNLWVSTPKYSGLHHDLAQKVFYTELVTIKCLELCGVSVDWSSRDFVWQRVGRVCRRGWQRSGAQGPYPRGGNTNQDAVVKRVFQI